MTEKWLNLFFKLSGFIFKTKQKLVQSESWVRVLPQALIIVVFELGFAIISLPMYLLVSPKAVQERGFIFPVNERDNSNKENTIRIYTTRRRISLATGLVAGIFIGLKILLIIATSLYLIGGQTLLAATSDWAFNTADDYTYNSAKIEVIDGVARLKNLGNTTSGATTNSGFDSNATGWTYNDGANSAGASGVYSATDGNPGGYAKVTLTSAENKITSGFWYQAFTTTVSSPDTATLNFDWSSIAATLPNPPDNYQFYAFISTANTNPILGTEVWSSGPISGTTAWASSETIDITSKVATAGTYYLKVLAYLDVPALPKATYTVVDGFDNVVVNWSKTTYIYDNSYPTINPTTSLSHELVTTWDSFTETATKNGGEIYYQLSDDDGATWQYYDGSIWTTAGVSNYNTASVVNTNISTFSTTSKKIRWKAFLQSDGSQQVILDNILIGYTANDPTHIQNLDQTQNATSSLINISYELVDDQSDPASLVAYEYSLTGDFTGEEVTMTASTTDPLHDGIVNLSSSPTGVAQTFVWDAKTQLGAIYDDSVYIRLRGNDGINTGDYATSTAFTIDYAAPVVTNLVASQVLGSSDVTITYDLSDGTTDNLLVEIDISEDSGSTWTVTDTSITGDIGSGITASTGKSITWSAGTDFSNQEQNDIRVRIRVTDAYNNISDYFESTDFSVDTTGPSGLVNFSKFSSTDVAATLNWSTGITDDNFNHYEIWHGLIASDVDNRTGTAIEWDDSDDANLTNINTISTVVTGLDTSNNYYMKIWAIDNYGNEVTLEAINIYEAPVITEPSGDNGGSSGGGPTLEFIAPDIIPPVKPTLDLVDTPTGLNNIFISGLAEPRSIIDLYDNGLLIGRLSSTADNNGRFGQSFNFSNGRHILIVKSIDFSNNISEPSNELIIVVDQILPAVDITPALPDTSITPPEVGPVTPSVPLPPSETPPVVGPVTPSVPLPPSATISEVIETVELPDIMVPEVSETSVLVIDNNIIQFSGTSLPNKDVVVYIHSDQALIYQTKADKDGNWIVNHSQDTIELTPGQHSIFAVTVDPIAKTRSLPSEVKLFEVRSNFLAVMFNLLNIQTTIITLLVISVAIFWLYRLKKRSLAPVIV